jgi:long-chain acyl-CoA synthetase
MAAVPKIWDVIKKGVQAKVAASSLIARFLVNTAFQARTFAINHGYDTPLFKALVFKKFSKVVGGRLRYAVSGGGPINSQVQEFIRVCFGMPLIQGYVSRPHSSVVRNTAMSVKALSHIASFRRFWGRV